jgi:hypothetical protein
VPVGVEQLEARITAWLCVWMLQPHVSEEEVAEIGAGLGEAVAAWD